MAGPGSTRVRSTTEAAAPVPVMRRMSLGMAVALLVQYGLGITVNLYVTVPARDHGGGVLTAVGRAFANGPAALAVHAGLGLLLILGAINLVVRAVRSHHRPLIWLSAISLAAILGAALNGAAFVDASNDGASLTMAMLTDGASLTMAMLTAVALLCMTVSLFVLSGGPGAAGSHGPDSTGRDAA